MTREEAIRQIRDNIDFRKRLQEGDKPQFFDAEENEKDIEAFEMAIKALSAEPCEDAISRQAVLDVTKRELFMGDAISEIENLPSVTPKVAECEDAISRQAVMDAMYELCGEGSLKDNPWRDNPHIDSIIYAIEHLPPVTPKITECEDAISRQAVMDAFNLSEKTRKYGGDHSGYDTMMLYEIQDVIEDLPSVQPKQKMGRWLAVDNEDMHTVDYFCSECDLPLETEERTPFCSNCGAKMEVSENG